MKFEVVKTPIKTGYEARKLERPIKEKMEREEKKEREELSKSREKRFKPYKKMLSSRIKKLSSPLNKYILQRRMTVKLGG